MNAPIDSDPCRFSAKKYARIFFLFLLLFLATSKVFSRALRAQQAQPYIDIARIHYAYSPEKKSGNNAGSLSSGVYSINLLAPVELQKGGDAFLVNPFFENNQGDVGDQAFHVTSLGLTAGFLKKSSSRKWSTLATFIFRRNKEVGEKVNAPYQYGGILLATFHKRASLAVKLGLYYNKEFFGNFFMPLAGIDWRIDDKNNLFGVLPGSLVFEHKVSSRFYWGSSFRALTNSYRLNTPDPCLNGDCGGSNYLRINDNQIGLFADTYITPKIALSAEAGYTVLRKYRLGFKGKTVHEFIDSENDNLYARVTLAYRLRLRQ